MTSLDQSAYEMGRCGSGEPMRPGGLELTARAIALCNLKKDARVLDIGCGSGITARYLRHVRGFKVFAMDVAPGDCPVSLERDPDTVWTRGCATSLPFQSKSMDLVIAECSFSLM